jgi:hypothetical protein
MRVGAYILSMSLLERRDKTLIEKILNEYFCPLVWAHGAFCTLSVCEDVVVVFPEQPSMYRYKYYDRFLKTPHAAMVSMAIVKCDTSLENVADMIKHVVQSVTHDDMVVEERYGEFY